MLKVPFLSCSAVNQPSPCDLQHQCYQPWLLSQPLMWWSHRQHSPLEREKGEKEEASSVAEKRGWFGKGQCNVECLFPESAIFQLSKPAYERLVSEIAVMPPQGGSKTLKLGINKYVDKSKIFTVRIDNEADVSSISPLSVQILHFR